MHRVILGRAERCEEAAQTSVRSAGAEAGRGPGGELNWAAGVSVPEEHLR